MEPKKYRNRFTHETGTNANLTKRLNALQAHVNFLETEKKKLENENLDLKEEIEYLKSISSEFFEALYNNQYISPILKSYIQILQRNVMTKPKGYRYEGLKEYFTLLSFIGPHYYELLSSNMIFPSYRRTLDYRKYFLDKFQITDNIYNGCIENVIQIMSKFLPQDFNGKTVMMVDAASVTPYVMIDEEGNVEGLINCNKLPVSIAKHYIEDEDAFFEFIDSNADQLIQAEFGISLAPLSPNYKSFPIACISSTSGKASLEMVSFLETLISQLNCHCDVIGIGTDGDKSYHKYCSQFMKKFIEGFDEHLDMDITEIIDKIAIIMHFSDPFHLVKRDRYRKVSISEFCVSPMKLDRTKNAEDFKSIGIPPYLLDDNKGRKMEDDLPKKFFSLLYTEKIIQKEDYELLISMLPSTLILESLHNKNLSRQMTIDYFLFGASIVIIFYCMSNCIINEQEKTLIERINEYKSKMCFTHEWCEEYIFTVMNIAYLVATEEEVNLGSCGSHYQEHDFANIRRHSKGDNTHGKFIKSMKYILLEKELYNQLEIDESVPVSRSDSGRSICGGEKVTLRPFGWYLLQAKRLWYNITDFPESSIIYSIDISEEKMEIKELVELFGSFSDKIYHSISTKSTGMIKTGGLRNARIWNAIEQMEDLLDYDDS